MVGQTIRGKGGRGVYIVVEVTLNRAEYGSQWSDQPESVNFEPIIRGLKSDIYLLRPSEISVSFM